ncbi:hypothetical protein M378DRAFT_174062 [Amanita muscaria Koide BX008]|uniref:Uncharacterized protein n=1 Tax=Amanita muscaria (strain Koide BX008) TaxID=946122 RepID=A0A0C2WDU9_AMAMK|nr:hypothetical protein M378DRAFT_174062 [Amanita muscaria Koide BX008]
MVPGCTVVRSWVMLAVLLPLRICIGITVYGSSLAPFFLILLALEKNQNVNAGW